MIWRVPYIGRAATLALVEEAATGDRLAQVCGNLKARALLAVAAALRARVDTRGRVRRNDRLRHSVTDGINGTDGRGVREPVHARLLLNEPFRHQQDGNGISKQPEAVHVAPRLGLPAGKMVPAMMGPCYVQVAWPRHSEAR